MPSLVSSGTRTMVVMVVRRAAVDRDRSVRAARKAALIPHMRAVALSGFGSGFALGFALGFVLGCGWGFALGFALGCSFGERPPPPAAVHGAAPGVRPKSLCIARTLGGALAPQDLHFARDRLLGQPPQLP